jgi:uncharacterized membrane protein YeaQ/YmgE (transglycosylase-associated protein family)
VADVGIAALVICLLAVVIAVVLRWAPGQQRRGTRALIGLVPGVLGAAIVLALHKDLVPDSFETFALPYVIVAVTAGVILLTIRNLAEL